MEICSSTHEEIVYDGEKCPLCAAMSDLEDKEKQIVEAKDEIAEIVNRIAAIEETIAGVVTSLAETKDEIEKVDLD